MRYRIIKIFLTFCLLMIVSKEITAQKKDQPLNILLITADDLGYEAVNSFGRNIPDLTPQMDKFANEGVQFNEAHTATPICQPSRAIMATGLYGVSSGMMGFIHMKKKVPTAMQTFRDHGYITGVLGKVRHSTPDLNYIWDFEHDYGDLGSGRSPKKYSTYATEFFEKCKKDHKPFYFMVNSHDPHRVFHNPDGKIPNGAENPSKIFTIDDVEVPKYLPKTDQVRLELSYYYNSVRRFDDTFGAVIKALKKAGLYQNTLIIVLSDNGSAFPFAKANSYISSTKTPFYVHYPGQMKVGLKDTEHMISEVDIFPTFLDAAGISIEEELDGKSILPLLKGEKQKGRNFVIGEIDYKIGGKATPIRSYGDKKFRYIFNPWSPTGNEYRNNNEGNINKDIEKNYPEYIRFVEFFRHRSLEEFYDVQKDPDAVNNLINDPAYKKEIKHYRNELKQWMKEKNDPVLVMLENVDHPEKMKEYLNTEYPDRNSLMPEEQLEIIRKRREEKKSTSKQSYAWEDLSKKDQAFLDLVQHKAFNFFWEGFDKKTGLIYDGHSNNRRTSVATSGFGLSAFIVGIERGWVSRDKAYKRILLTLNSFYKDPNNPTDFCVEGRLGFFYHFFNIDTGKRNGKSEVSTIDTAILMAGMIDVMEYFKGTEVEILAKKIYQNAQWDKYINDEKAVVGGWRPEMKPVAVYKGYNEYNLVYLLGLGSPSYALPDTSWKAWASGKGFIPIKPYNDIGEFLTPHGVLQPLAYMYQFPACWYDFRKKSDEYVNYYQMSINALKSNKKYTNNWGYVHGYPEELWGWTAVSGRDGYLGFSHPYIGTLAPSAVLASLSFMPKESLRSIKYMYKTYGDKIFKEYGFVDSFNPYQNWYDDTYLGIDKGNEVLSIENYRSGSIWKRFMNNPYVKTGMRKANFKNM